MNRITISGLVLKVNPKTTRILVNLPNTHNKLLDNSIITIRNVIGTNIKEGDRILVNGTISPHKKHSILVNTHTIEPYVSNTGLDVNEVEIEGVLFKNPIYKDKYLYTLILKSGTIFCKILKQNVKELQSKRVLVKGYLKSIDIKKGKSDFYRVVNIFTHEVSDVKL